MATSRYTKVAALIIRWTEELDLQAEGHTNEIAKLIKAFERFKFADFHCKVVRLTNKRKPQGQLERAISEHIDDHDGSRSLLIVYYTGHGMGLAEDKLGLAALGLMTTATELHDPIARWDDAERPLIKTADADVLTILDCCYSSNAVKAVTNDPRVYELLAACPFNEKTWGPSPTSLTTALTTALNHLLDKHGQEGFAVRALIQHILMIRMKPVAMYWDRLGTYQRSIILAPGPDFSKPIHDSQLELKDVTVSEREGSRNAKGGQKTKTNEPQADVQASSAEPRQDDVYDMKGEDLHEASQLSEEHLNPAASSSEGGHEYSEAHEQAHDPEADDSRHDRDRGGIATTETRETKTSGSLGANFDSPLPGLDDGDLQRRSWFQDKVDTVIGKANGYLHVAVLMIRWDESIDDFVRHTEEIDRLRTIFRDQFNYDCSVVNITTLPKPQLQFNRAISDFILNHDGPDNLLIIYYTGHGFTVDSEVERTRLVLCANQQSVRARERALEVRWDTAEAPLLHDTESDVITILDCSFASTAAIKAVEKSIRAYQLLAASAIDSPARGPGLQSFSTSLANSLEELVHESKKEGFPLIKLLETINVKNGMRESPAMLWDRLRTFRPFIHLAPMPKERRSKNGITLRTGEPETGALILRFSLKNTTDGLTLKQIEALARQLPKACIDANLPLRRIEWLGYIGRENLRVEKFRDAVRTTMLARAVCRKWRSYVEARRQQRDKTRAQIENAPEPTDSKRKRSETLQSPLPPSKQALYEERKRSETLQSLLHPSKQARYEVEPGSPQRMPSPSDSEDAYGGLMPDRKN